MPITVVVDRDSVAMGDDVESHVETWTMPDDARLCDVVARAVTDHYLASVAGDVAWTLEGAGLAVAALDVRADGSTSILQLPGWPLSSELAERPVFLAGGVYSFVFRYSSGGSPRSWAQFEQALGPFRR